MMDNGVEADVAAIKQNIDEAEVICVFFPVVGKTLIIDTRSSVHAEPMVSIVPMARSAQERFRSLRRIRPELPRPRSVTFIPWHRRVDSLLHLGVWERILNRVESLDDGGCYVALADRCLADLQDLERREFALAIAGTEYRTLWPRTSPA